MRATKNTPETTPPTTKTGKPKMGSKAASLLEAGMILALIAISAIGAVFVAGDNTQEIFCDAHSEMERSLGLGEGTCVADGPGGGGENPGGGGGQGGGENPGGGGGEGSGGGTPPGVDYSGMALTGATYPERTIGLRNDFTALPVGHGGGQILSIAATSGAGIEACYQIDPAQAAVCGASLTLPSAATTIGWQADLPIDVRAAFQRTFTVRLATSGGTVLRDFADLNVLRAQAANWLALSTTFPSILYPEGTTGLQTHMRPLAGLTTPSMILTAPVGQPLAPCWQATATDPVSCGAVAGSITVPGTAYAIGFQVNDLPTNVRTPFSTTNRLQMASSLEPGNPIEWTIARERTPAGPDYTAMSLTGASYPARTTGVRTQFTPLPADHGGGQRLLLTGVSGVDLTLCYQTDPAQAAVCGMDLTLPAEATTIGWQATLPTDVRAAYARSFTVQLNAASGANLRQWNSLLVNRTQATNWLELSTNFPAITYAAGTTGTQTHMQPLVGTTTPSMTLSIPNGQNLAPCWQAGASDAVTCGAAGGSIAVPDTAYAIGFRAFDLPADPRATFGTTSALHLASSLEPGNPVSWAITRTRPTTPIALSWNAPSPSTYTFPVGTVTESYAMFPLSGTFNGPMTLELGAAPTWAGTYGLCYQVGTDTPVCSAYGTAWTSQRHTIPANTTAIGFRHSASAFPTNLKSTWGGSVQVVLTSTLDSAFTQARTLSVTRTQESIVFQPTISLANSTWQTYHYNTGNTVTNMVPLTGTFNDPMTLRLSAGGTSNLQVCRQATSGGTITCSAGNTTLAVQPTDFAIGVRYTFTGTNPYATSNQPTVTFEATNDTAQNVTFTPRMERVPETVATNERNFSVARVVTGPVTMPVLRSTWTSAAGSNRFFRSGVGEQARITVLSNDGPVTVRLCSYGNGSSSGNIGLMCNNAITAVGATTTRAINGTGEDMWLQYDAFGAAGTARNISIQLEVWNTVNPSATMRTYTINMARGS